MVSEPESLLHLYGHHEVTHYRDGHFTTDQEINIPAETPVALVYNGIAHTVMMCSAAELEDFAVGFSLSEGIIKHDHDIHEIDVLPGCQGWAVHIELANRCVQELKERRRTLAGRTGCGICGTESLEQVIRPLPRLAHTQVLDVTVIDSVLAQLREQQPLGRLTGATHAAVHLTLQGEITAIREDIGRHIALDKLIGHLCRTHQKGGAILVTSRASFEMVQKCASAGVEILLAISAATQLAVECAEAAGLTLVGFCRPGRAEIYTQAERIRLGHSSFGR